MTDDQRIPHSIKTIDDPCFNIDSYSPSTFLIYDLEFKRCTNHNGGNPFRFNTQNLKGIFKFHIAHTINYDLNNSSSYFHVSKMHKYDNIKHLTKNKVYDFVCLTPSECDVIRIPSPDCELTKYNDELYDYLLNNPGISAILFQNSSGIIIETNSETITLPMPETIPILETIIETKPETTIASISKTTHPNKNFDIIDRAVHNVRKYKIIVV